MNISYLILKFLIGGGLIVGVTFLTKYINPRLGGFLVVAPIITTLSIIFVKFETNLQTTQELILSSIYYFIPTLIFLILMYFLISKVNLISSFVISYAIWAVIVFAMQKWIH